MDFLSNVIAGFALVVSIISLIKSNSTSKAANKLTEAANDLTKGQVEMQIREIISTAKARYADIAIQLSKDNDNETLISSTFAALEDVLNAYDEACSKYIDKKVDVSRFKKLYITEIRNLVEDDNTKSFYFMPQSKFQATVKVYREWNNLE